MTQTTVVFPATGRIQTFVVPETGDYVIDAAGAQGGPGGGPGGKGARVVGRFRLQRGDMLQILVGRQGMAGNSPHRAAGGGGGGTFVWRGATALPLPAYPLLAAGGGGGGGGGDGLISHEGGAGAAPGGRDGHGGEAVTSNFSYSGGGGAGWRSAGSMGSTPTVCGGGTISRGGGGANYCCNTGGNGGFGGGGGGAFLGNGSGGGGGYSGGGGGSQAGAFGGGGGSYNAGADQINVPGAQTGDGVVTVTLVQALADAAHMLAPGETAPAVTGREPSLGRDAAPDLKVRGRYVGVL